MARTASCSRRIRIARHARMMKAAEHAARTHSLLRHLLRLPVGDRRVRAQRLHARRRGFDRGGRGRTARVIYKLRDLLGVEELGGTMRLGKYECELAPVSLARQIYGTDVIRNGIATASSSTVSTNRRCASTGCAISGRSPTASSSRSRAAQPSVVHRGAVPPRVPVAAAEAASALRRVVAAAAGRRRASRAPRSTQNRSRDGRSPAGCGRRRDDRHGSAARVHHRPVCHRKRVARR
jgi:hypothetical protein